MSLLFDTTIKVSLILLLALAAAELLHRRSAAIRHWVLAVAVACALAAPLLGLLLPSWQFRLTMAASPSAPAPESTSVVTTTILGEPLNSPVRSEPQSAIAVETNPVSIDVPRILTAVWAAGAAVSFLMLVAGLGRLAWFASAARRVERGRWIELTREICRTLGVRRSVVLLESHRSTVLGTWGVAKPKILLPRSSRDWSDDRARIVLRHELSHVQRGDWAVQMAAEGLRALYWFNPLAWIVCARLRRESEHACDDSVLSAGIPGSDYASHLVEIARTLKGDRGAWLPVPAMARPSSLTGRISAMLNSSVNRGPLTRLARVATIIGLMLVTVSIAGFGAQGFFTFSGSVLDTTNRFLSSATVIVTDTARGAKHEVKSDATGHFELIGLPPGEYGLEVRIPGFFTHKSSLSILGRDVDRTIELRVGDLEETITVVASSESEAGQEPQRREVAQGRVVEQRRAAIEKCDGAGVGPIGGKIVPPVRLTNANPQYPDHLRIAKVGGVVTMEALIGTDGNVADIRVVDSPHPDLDRAATEAVRQWQYTQTLLNCTPVEIRMQVTTNFRVQP